MNTSDKDKKASAKAPLTEREKNHFLALIPHYRTQVRRHFHGYQELLLLYLDLIPHLAGQPRFQKHLREWADVMRAVFHGGKRRSE